jgi:hypothetical protein
MYGVGQRVCDWALLNDFVEDFVRKALSAVGEVSSRGQRERTPGKTRSRSPEDNTVASHIIIG